jgi:desulfoferrodoxin (superoxide reductase-like protein)
MKLATDYIIKQGEETYYASISPCCWMYSNYGMQVKVSSDPGAYNAESHFIRWSTLYANATEQEVIAKITEFFKQGGAAIIKKAVADWAVEEKRFRAEIAELDRQQAEEDAKEHAKAKAAGYTHYIIYWIHGVGDDVQKKAFTKGEPTQTTINRLLGRSAIKTDYKIFVL